eukprot:1457131-Pyramimonas_sp.AAC.1
MFHMAIHERLARGQRHEIHKDMSWARGWRRKGRGRGRVVIRGPQGAKVGKGRRTLKGGPKKALRGLRSCMFLDVPGAALRSASREHLGGALLGFSRAFLKLYQQKAAK